MVKRSPDAPQGGTASAGPGADIGAGGGSKTCCGRSGEHFWVDSGVGLRDRTQGSESWVGFRGRIHGSDSGIGLRGRIQGSDSGIGVRDRTRGQR